MVAGANGPHPPPPTFSHIPPWSSTTTAVSILFSCIILFLSFYQLAPRYPTAKQLAWVLSTISSAVMTLSSLPFLYDYFSHGASVQYVRMIPNLSISALRFFQTYLVVDLALGQVYYRSQLGLLTGWIHHSVYIMIVELAIRRSWSHVFCLCSAMEVPTFILGFMTLHPALRSNIVFAVAFFLTRILFHIILGVSYFLHDNRTQALGGSYIPSVLLATIFPLHAMWFYSCIQGFFRRASRRHTLISTLADIPSTLDNKISPSPASQNKRTARRNRPKVIDNARSTDTTPSPTTFSSNQDLKLDRSKLPSRRFYSPRSLSLSSNDSRSSVTGRLRTKLYASLPNREVVFEYVGLGRKSSAQEQ